MSGDASARRSRCSDEVETTLVGVAERDGALLPARAQDDRDVVVVDAALLAQLVRGDAGELEGIRHY